MSDIERMFSQFERMAGGDQTKDGDWKHELTSVGPDISKLVSERVSELLQNQEHFIARYLAETGSSVVETQLVHQTMKDGTVRFWCEPRNTERDSA